jgi:hypothetical protein
MRRYFVMLLTAVLGGACTAPDPAPKLPAVTPTTPAPEAAPIDGSSSKGSTPSPPATSGPCEALSRTACMQSTECTLEQEGERSRRYRCRPATEPCERGFAQAGFWGSGTEGVRASKAQQAACDARPGCGFVDGGCYCHCRGMGETAVPDGDEAEGCACECSGGPPPTCRAKQ